MGDSGDGGVIKLNKGSVSGSDNFLRGLFRPSPAKYIYCNDRFPRQPSSYSYQRYNSDLQRTEIMNTKIVLLAVFVCCIVGCYAPFPRNDPR